MLLIPRLKFTLFIPSPISKQLFCSCFFLVLPEVGPGAGFGSFLESLERLEAGVPSYVLPSLVHFVELHTYTYVHTLHAYIHTYIHTYIHIHTYMES